MFEKELQDMGKRLARVMLPSALRVGYVGLKAINEAKVMFDEQAFLSKLANKEHLIEENLKGKAGDKATEAIGKIHAESKFKAGVNSIK
ncbi:methyl-accepting chemotaxis protein [Weissella oryzae SG25]|uniref:Methyl-accepting chemotaxis protein n=1 Tax=Weissella oryzae (strain DSM 25784 / JCM 18191 / LMG 30913 / SG25) TaxID=1329250 RepID=A0A069CUR9_WEIOS|nr:hypothetical protein [Weissella oryzae]GAK31219.1 methyl-accepting chemotaxis protein [Weissella oryzae SG25]